MVQKKYLPNYHPRFENFITFTIVVFIDVTSNLISTLSEQNLIQQQNLHEHVLNCVVFNFI